MRRFVLGACSTFAALALVAGAAPGCGSDDSGESSSGGASSSSSSSGFIGGNDGGNPDPACVNLCQQQVKCDNGGKTTVSGTVFDPAGKVPIYNAIVYVPNAAPASIPEGASCDRCDAKVSGSPLVITQTDVEGKFTLENMPVGQKIPLVIQIGKWRRQVEIPAVDKCVNTPIDAGMTRLPKNRNEGNIPRIALATGAADPLQCLLRKMGLDDAEFGAPGSESRVHLYAGGGYDSGGARNAQKKFTSGADFGNAETLWGTAEELKKYDMVLLSCEGTENDTEQHKPAAAKQAVYDYAKAGGRVFASHYHHTFFSSASAPAAPAETQGVASWANPEKPPPAIPSDPATTAVNSDIVGTFPKAVAMKQWLEKQGALAGDKLPIYDARHNVNAVNATALNWIEAVNPNDSNSKAVQYMTFNTPVGAAEDAVCGRVVFSNLHVGAGQQGGVSDDPTDVSTFPDGCKTTDLSAQQKALEFMLFDLSSCVQKDDAPIEVPK